MGIGLARLGAATGYLGGISQDGFGANLLQRVQIEGVDSGPVKQSRAPTELAVVSTGPYRGPSYTFPAVSYGYGNSLPSNVQTPLPALVEAVAGSCALAVKPVEHAASIICCQSGAELPTQADLCAAGA